MRATLLVALLAGCEGSLPDEVAREDLAVWAAAVSCDRAAECARAQFEVAYYSIEDCRASEEKAWQLTVELVSEIDACDYDETRASNRLEEVQQMSCEEWYEGESAEAFGEIWEDCPLFGF